MDDDVMHPLLLSKRWVDDGRIARTGLLPQPHVAQHHHATQQQRGGVGLVLARDVGRGAMHRLKHGGGLADVAAGCQAQAANEACTHTADTHKSQEQWREGGKR